MKYIVCAVRDSAADAYMRPIFAPSQGVAIRSFREQVNDKNPDNSFNRHPGDFVLFRLGSFDDNTCVFECGVPEQLIRAIDVKEDDSAA